jgi:hypothetical protein
VLVTSLLLGGEGSQVGVIAARAVAGEVVLGKGSDSGTAGVGLVTGKLLLHSWFQQGTEGGAPVVLRSTTLVGDEVDRNICVP